MFVGWTHHCDARQGRFIRPLAIYWFRSNDMREAVIVEAVRTPIGRRNGKLKDIHPVVLGSLVLKEIVQRAGIEPGQVDDVVFGCVSQAGEQSLNIGRSAWLTAGLPVT